MPQRLDGSALVVTMYAIIVAFAGTVGAIIGALAPDLLGEELEPVMLLGVVKIQPTPLGLATFGSVTIGLVLAVLLLLVMYVSRYDDAAV